MLSQILFLKYEISILNCIKSKPFNNDKEEISYNKHKKLKQHGCLEIIIDHQTPYIISCQFVSDFHFIIPSLNNKFVHK